MSERTKQCYTWYVALTIVHLLCIFGPFLFFIPQALTNDVSTTRKVALTLSIVVSCILLILALIVEAKSRAGLSKTVMWLLILGVMVCLKEAQTFIYVMACVSIVDELFITKLRDKYKDAYRANKEIDRRL